MATPIPDNQVCFTADELRIATAGHFPFSVPDWVQGLTTDSRRVRPGNLFVALRGELHDGHAFVAKAGAAGAGAVLVDEAGARGLEASATPLLVVPDTLIAWGQLASAHLRRERARRAFGVLAITGSTGKTTTKEMTAGLLAGLAPTLRTAGNLNNRIGLPATALTLRDERWLVLEAGMSLPGEMAELGRIAQPDVAAVVNVGLAHAEGVGGREGVAREKNALLASLGPGGLAVVPHGDPLVEAGVPRGMRCLRFGEGAGADYRLLERRVQGTGSVLRLALGGREVMLRSPYAGLGQALDLCCALAMVEGVTGDPLEVEAIELALAALQLEGRAQLHALRDGGMLLDDVYNANPDSMAAALRLLDEVAGSRRRVAVLGEMRELGAHAETAHRELGRQVASQRVDSLIVLGGLTELTADEAERAGVRVHRARDDRDAVDLALSEISPKDAVLVKASRGVRAERIVAPLLHRFGLPRAE